MSSRRPDWLSFLCGLIFVLTGLAYLVALLLGIRIEAVWAVPLLFVVLGVAGLAGTARARNDRDR